ncbi:MAG TPA: UDP-N-acetylglucosamine 1-carboxyvinyltransferase [Spirochaetota bacterium]|nr:UDP-N-acetylglucosamine 1-carboxyvinyltransferase [Spirochaetota bacterium]HOD13585.1 UDP-N-acetylglucosamine 1-carboxyvinyltransferase [Spirochaetota bacterium]HPG49729.1 UDP-N-acetylglucosamine 1-carboxyvinyltransferase [Spirochaetota bacterium]HPN10427.1 UDP-N-acetylglucosamine 1-carboxyvinyltransferase [Spirochaetota bacterium]HQL80813.1 UDP-N-acetylglucosamine 1-carboxyvinyltransferase [Spirochaetota bacterium]
MDMYRIQGGTPLSGEVPISGAKNAALPIIVASLLADGETVLKNVPDLKDIRTILQVIECLGANYNFDTAKNTLRIRVSTIRNAEVPYDLVKTMRASVYVMGPLLARVGEADVSLPGGCAIGERPVDIHLSGFEAMGTEVTLEHGYIKARAKTLAAAEFKMRQVSVGATANIMMAAVLAKGKTVLENCAMEPDVVDLGNFLTKMGAKITGLGTERIEIEGVKKLQPVTYSVIPDRIEAGTYLIAGAATKGEVKITGAAPEHVASCMASLADMGFTIDSGRDWVSVAPGKNLKGTIIKTMPYPGFPTDLQAPVMALSTIVPGINVIIETIFENRFTHVGELRRMGADITIEGNVVIVKGVGGLMSAPIMMSDLRAGAALVVAALTAKGETEIRRIYHCDRGYERMAEKLTALGARIERVKGGGA